MATIEERVVSMKFDNAQFKSGASDTLRTLEGLKSKIAGSSIGSAISKTFNGSIFSSFKKSSADAADSFSQISRSAASVDLSPASRSIGDLMSSFSMLETVGVGALMNIGNQVSSFAMNKLHDFAVKPITDGFNEYETKIKSIQTIYANTGSKFGTKIPEIEASLDELNTYADETIYNFGDMTRNIGLFTNAGLNVQESTSMIKGFSNAAAASGTNAEDASRAAYQLSQGLSAGSIKLMDWNSLVNAGMGNSNMKQSLVDLGHAMGTLGEDSMNTAKSIDSDFRDSLSDGWLSADVMSTYLQAMAGDMDKTALKAKGLTDKQADFLLQNATIGEEAATKVRTFTQLMEGIEEQIGSAWGETFDILLGGFEGSSQIFTGINNAVEGVLGTFNSLRNDPLKEWAKGGGREALINAIANAFRNLGNILKPIGQAFNEVFNLKSGAGLIAISKGLEELTSKVQISEQAAEGLRLIFKGLFVVIKAAVTVIGTVLGAALKVLGIVIIGISRGLNFFIERLEIVISALIVFAQMAGRGFSVLLGYAGRVKSALMSFDLSKLKDMAPNAKIFSAFSKLAIGIQLVREVWKLLTGDLSKPMDLKIFGDRQIEQFRSFREALSSVRNYWANFSAEDAKHIGRVFQKNLKDVDIKSADSVKNAAANITSELTTVDYEQAMRGLNAVETGIRSTASAIKNSGTNLKSAFETIKSTNWKQLEPSIAAVSSITSNFTGADENAIKNTLTKQAGNIQFGVKALGDIDWGDADSVAKGVESLKESFVSASKNESIYDNIESIVPSDKLKKISNNTINAVKGLSQTLKEAGRIDWSSTDSIATGLTRVQESFNQLKTGSFEDLTGIEIAPDIKFVGLTDAIKSGFYGIRDYDYAGFFDGLREKVSGLGVKMGSWISESVSKVDWSHVGAVIAKGLSLALGAALGSIGVLATLIGDFFKGLFTSIDLGPVGGIFEGFISELGKSFKSLANIVDGLAVSMEPVVQRTMSIISGALRLAGKAVDMLINAFSQLTGDDPLAPIRETFSKFGDILKNLSLADIITGIGIALTGLGVAGAGKGIMGFADTFSSIGEGIVGVLEKVSGQADEAPKIQIYADALMTLAIAFGIAAVSALILAFAISMVANLEWDQVQKGLITVAGAVLILVAALALINKMNISNSFDDFDPKKGVMGNIMTSVNNFLKVGAAIGMMLSAAVAIMALSFAIMMMTKAVKELGKMDKDELQQGVTALIVILGSLTLAVRALPEKDLMKSAIAIILLAFAVGALSKGIKKLGELSWEELSRGLIGLAVALAVLIAATLGFAKFDLNRVTANFMLLSVAMIMLAYAFKLMAKIPFQDFLKGYVVFGAVLGGVILATKMADEKQVRSLADSMMILAASMVVMAMAFMMFATMSYADIIKGLLTVLGVLVVFGTGLKAFPKTQVMTSAAVIIAIAAALLILSFAIEQVASLDLGALIKTIVVLGVFMGAMALISKMTAGGGKKGGGKKGGLMSMFGDTGQMAKLAINMMLLAAAISALAFALGMLLPVIIAFSAAGLGTIVEGLLGMGAVFMVLALGGMMLQPVVGVFLQLSVAMLTGAAAVVVFGAGLALVGIGILAIAGAITMLAAVAPAAFVTIGTGLAAMIGMFIITLGQMAPMIGPALEAILLAIFAAIEGALPGLKALLVTLVEEIVSVIQTAGPTLIEGVISLVMMLLEGLVNLLVTFVPRFIEGVIQIIEAMATAIDNNQERFRAAIRQLLNAAGDVIVGMLGDFLQMGWNLVKALGDGFMNGVGAVVEKVKEGARKVVNGAKNVLGIKSPSRVFMGIGGHISAGLGIGIEKNNRPTKSSRKMAKGVIDASKDELEINSPSKVFVGIGKSIGDGMAIGIDSGSDKAVNSMGSMMDRLMAVFTSKMGAMDKLVFAFAAINPLTKSLDELSKKAKRTREDALKEREEKAKEEKKRLERELEDAEDSLADNRDKLAEAKDKKAEKAETKIKPNKDSKKGKEKEKTKGEEKRDAAKEKREAAKSEREARRTRRNIADTEEKIQKLKQEREEYDANVKGYLAGRAFAKGTKSGMSDAHEELKSELDIFVDLVGEKVDEVKKEFTDFKGIFEGLSTVKSSFSGLRGEITNLSNSLMFLNSSASDEWTSISLDGLLESGAGIVGVFENLVGVFDKLKPYLGSVLGKLDRMLPAIIPMVAQFAPALAASLGGGLTAALPTILGAATGIIAAIWGIVTFLKDLANGGTMLKTLQGIFNGIIRFIADIPKRLAKLVRTLFKGLNIFIQKIPELLPSMVFSLIDGLVDALSSLPELASAIIVGLINSIVTILSSPGFILEAAIRIVFGLVEGIAKAFMGLFSNMRQIGVDIVKALAEGVKSGFKTLWDTIIAPFKLIIDSIRYIFDPTQWGKTPPWRQGIPGLPASGMSKIPSMIADQIVVGSGQVSTSRTAGLIAGVEKKDLYGDVGRYHESVINNYNFTQNNTSAKPLDTYSIYKKTKTQLEMAV